MEKTTTLNLRINPDVKRRAEEVLSRLGIPMSTAIDIYLKQISMTGGIPFAVTLPKAPISVNSDLMTTDEIHAKLKEGYSDIEKGNVQDASAAFQRRNYTEVLKEVSYKKPVYLTRNGRGEYVIIKVEELDKLRAMVRLMAQLEEGEKSAREKGWLSADEVEVSLGL